MIQKEYHASWVYQIVHSALYNLGKGEMLTEHQMEVVQAMAFESATRGFADGYMAANNARWASDYQARRLLEDSKGESDDVR